MVKEYYYDSCGRGKIRACVWEPEGMPKAIVQFVHGIGEHIGRYDHFARYLNSQGVLVVGQDHMGHGKSIADEGLKGYFYGGWSNGVEDIYRLTKATIDEYPGIPYFLYGHSMGSFLVRTLIAQHPDADLTGCIICGTGWQSKALLTVAKPLCNALTKKAGEKNASLAMQKLMFGNYNKRIEHQRTVSDWLSRDEKIVDAYESDPLCGFVACSGLQRDMIFAIDHIQKKDTLQSMNKELPVLFIAGGDDPVGNYGKGVVTTAKAFKDVGMVDVTTRIYPLGRHEIHNEINKEEVYRDVLNWINSKI